MYSLLKEDVFSLDDAIEMALVLKEKDFNPGKIS